MFVPIFEIIAWVVIWLFFFTQILGPVWNGTPCFPLFRKKQGAQIISLEEARERVEAARLERDVKTTLKQAETIRKETDNG